MNDLLNLVQNNGHNEAMDRKLQQSILSSKYLEKVSTMIEHEQFVEAMNHLDKLLTALKRPLDTFRDDPSREFASLDYILPLTVQRLTECIYSAANSNNEDMTVPGLETLISSVTIKDNEKVENEQPGKVNDERFLNIVHTIEDFLITKGLSWDFEHARFYSLVMAEICSKLVELGKRDNIPNCKWNTKIFIRRQFKDQTQAVKTWKLIGTE